MTRDEAIKNLAFAIYDLHASGGPIQDVITALRAFADAIAPEKPARDIGSVIDPPDKFGPYRGIG